MVIRAVVWVRGCQREFDDDGLELTTADAGLPVYNDADYTTLKTEISTIFCLIHSTSSIDSTFTSPSQLTHPFLVPTVISAIGPCSRESTGDGEEKGVVKAFVAIILSFLSLIHSPH